MDVPRLPALRDGRRASAARPSSETEADLFLDPLFELLDPLVVGLVDALAVVHEVVRLEERDAEPSGVVLDGHQGAVGAQVLLSAELPRSNLAHAPTLATPRGPDTLRELRHVRR